MKNKKAFTLAEILITLSILGLVAAIVLPTAINRAKDSANRTKLKKALSMYERAINNIVSDNDFKDINTMDEWGLKDGGDNSKTYNCANAEKYFKIAQYGKKTKKMGKKKHQYKMLS